MTVRAVILDLPIVASPASIAAWERIPAEMARVLTAQAFEFAQVWARISADRELQGGGTIEGDIDDALRHLNVFTHLDQRREAAGLLYDAARNLLEPRADVLDSLHTLRRRSLRLGLVANALPIIARLWPASPMATLIDIAVFSCDVHLRLPDSAICHLAAARLSVPAEECALLSPGDPGRPWPGPRPATLRDLVDHVRPE